MLLRDGERVGTWVITGPLGHGGQGSVWRAVDLGANGAPRALKLFDRERTEPAARERARREAESLLRVDHPAVVRCFGFVDDAAHGVLGLALELVEGDALADVLDDPRLTRAHRFAVLAQLAHALGRVHEAGVVHRDFKPENVLVSRDFWAAPTRPGTVKLVDFGIASPLGNPRPLTATGEVIGTLPFLPPELIDPATWGSDDHGFQRDVFAFGVVAYRVLVGRHPTGLGPGASMLDYGRAYVAASVGRIPWPPPGLEGGWGATVAACLALRAAQRPASGREVVERLRAGRVGEGVAPGVLEAPTAPQRPLMRATRARVDPAPGRGGRRALVAVLGLGSCCALAAGLAFEAWAPQDGAPPSIASVAPPVPASAVTSASTPAHSVTPAPPPESRHGAPHSMCCGGACVKGTALAATCAPPIPCATRQQDIDYECMEALPADASFRLRLSGVWSPAPNRGEFAKFAAGRGVRIKVSAGGGVVVSKLSDTGDAGCADLKSLLIRVSDLVSGGVTLELEVPGYLPVIQRATVSGGSLSAKALCDGIKLPLSGSVGGVPIEFVTFFLDPP